MSGDLREQVLQATSGTGAKADRLLERIAVAVEGQRRALERIAEAFEREPPAGCEHPPEWRTDESTMGHLGRWVCDPAKGGCGNRNYART